VASGTVDQAEGLRRMFGTARARAITVVGGRAGVGRTLVAANLATALARSGRATLLADAHDGEARAATALGLATPASAAQDRLAPLDERILAGPHGLAVLPVDLGSGSSQARLHACRCALAEALARYGESLDVLLLAAPPGAVPAPLLPPERHDVIVVLSRAASSITEAYAAIKRMSAEHGQRSFHVLVNRVGAEAEALVIFQNMARVADGYLDVKLQLMGYVPADERLPRAASLGRSVLDAWPGAPATAAFRRLAEDIGGWPVPRTESESARAFGREPAHAY